MDEAVVLGIMSAIVYAGERQKRDRKIELEKEVELYADSVEVARNLLNLVVDKDYYDVLMAGV